MSASPTTRGAIITRRAREKKAGSFWGLQKRETIGAIPGKEGPFHEKAPTSPAVIDEREQEMMMAVIEESRVSSAGRKSVS